MDNNLKEKFKFRIAISELVEESEKNFYQNQNIINKKIVAACACMVLTSGIVFAKDIEKFIKDKFHLGNGVQTAINNGYIKEVKNEYCMSECEIIDSNEKHLNNSDIGIKVDNFFIDNYNFSIDFNIKLDNSLINIDMLNNLRLGDIIITDNKNRIIYTETSKENFERFCNNKNLNYNYLEFNKNYLNTGLNNFIQDFNNSENLVNLIYNIYLENEEFPKSEKINIYFEKIEFEAKDTNGDLNKLIALGSWNIDLDVPLKMINREEQEYEVVSCEDENFEVYATKATDTGFELGIMISNIEKPTYPKELDEQKKEIYKNYGTVNKSNTINNNSNTKSLAVATVSSKDISQYYENSPFKSMYEDYYTKQYPIGNVRENFIYWYPKTDGNYIINSNGDKFFVSTSVGAKAKYSFIDGNKFEYYTTFDMTKYDLTKNVTAIIELYGKPIKIELKSNMKY